MLKNYGIKLCVDMEWSPRYIVGIFLADRRIWYKIKRQKSIHWLVSLDSILSPSGFIFLPCGNHYYQLPCVSFQRIVYECKSRTSTHRHTFWKHKWRHIKALFYTLPFLVNNIFLWGRALKSYSKRETASQCTPWIIF